MKKNKLLLCSEGFSIFGGWIDFIVILSIAAFKFNINSFASLLLLKDSFGREQSTSLVIFKGGAKAPPLNI